MPSPFDQLDAAAQAAIETTFGEGIRVRPMVGGDYSKTADPERAVAETRAIVSRADKTADANYPGTNRSSANMITAPLEAWIDRAALAALGYEPRRGDIIELLDETGTPSAMVTAAHAGENGDCTLDLVYRGADET